VPAVDGDQHDRARRLWAKVDEGLDSYAALRLADTALVVFESRDAAIA
jgi:hypothetical protein